MNFGPAPFGSNTRPSIAGSSPSDSTTQASASTSPGTSSSAVLLNSQTASRRRSLLSFSRSLLQGGVPAPPAGFNISLGLNINLGVSLGVGAPSIDTASQMSAISAAAGVQQTDAGWGGACTHAIRPYSVSAFALRATVTPSSPKLCDALISARISSRFHLHAFLERHRSRRYFCRAIRVRLFVADSPEGQADARLPSLPCV